jgi:hypothetical protein
MVFLRVLIAAALHLGIDALSLTQQDKVGDHQVVPLAAGLCDMNSKDFDNCQAIRGPQERKRKKKNKNKSREPAFPIYISSTNTTNGTLRRISLSKQCLDQNLHCMVLPFTDQYDKWKGSTMMAATMAKLFKDSPHEAAILAEDDIQFIPNFREELRKTLDDVPNPDDLDLMHLCPGGLWGRHGPVDNKFNMRAQDTIPNEKPSVNGRVFLEFPNFQHRMGVFPGAPLTVYMRKKGAEQVYPYFDKMADDWLGRTAGNDVLFRKLATDWHPRTHWVAREPQLCKEQDYYRP